MLKFYSMKITLDFLLHCWPGQVLDKILETLESVRNHHVSGNVATLGSFPGANGTLQAYQGKSWFCYLSQSRQPSCKAHSPWEPSDLQWRWPNLQRKLLLWIRIKQSSMKNTQENTAGKQKIPASIPQGLTHQWKRPTKGTCEANDPPERYHHSRNETPMRRIRKRAIFKRSRAKRGGQSWGSIGTLEMQKGKPTVQVLSILEREDRDMEGGKSRPHTAGSLPGNGEGRVPGEKPHVSNTVNRSKPKPRQIASPAEQQLPQSLETEKRKRWPAKHWNKTERGVFPLRQEKLEGNRAAHSMSGRKGSCFWMTDHVEHLFEHLLTLPMSSIPRAPSNLLPFLKLDFLFYCCVLMVSVYSGCKSVIRFLFCKFLPVCDLLFNFLQNVFHREVFNFDMVQFPQLFFFSYFGVPTINSLFHPAS